VLHDPAEGRFHRGAEDVVAHELAHHWFGDLVTCRSWRDLWVNEGITTFAAMAWAREARGEDAWADAWYGRVRGLAGRKDARPLVTDFFTRDGDRENADVYTKGAAVMQMLLVLLGEEAFRRGLHAYVEKHSYSLVHTSDLQRAFEDATGASLSWFFDQWAYLAGAPILRVAAAPDGAGLRVSIAQTQAVSGLVPRFTLPVDLEIGTDRSVRRERVWVDGHDAVVARIPLDGRLRWLAVDPDGGLVATIEQEQGEAAWIAQAASSPSAYARRVAMAALAERKGPPTAEARAFVTGRFRDEGAPEAVRTVAASVLGAFRDDGAREELLAMAPTVSPQLRAAIVDALAGFPPASASTRWLLEVARADASEHVRAAAVVALSAAMGRDALPSARLALRDRGVEGAVRIAAADLLGRWGDEGDVRLLAPLRGGTTEHGVRVAALWASVRIVARGRDADVRERLGESVADDAVAMLGDLHLRARQTAVAVLTELAQPRTEAALLASKTREREPALLTAIDAAVTAVRSMKAAPAEAPSETEARLRALEERFDALRKDFEEAASRR
jgi:aminopeptidase N